MSIEEEYIVPEPVIDSRNDKNILMWLGVALTYAYATSMGVIYLLPIEEAGKIALAIIVTFIYFIVFSYIVHS